MKSKKTNTGEVIAIWALWFIGLLFNAFVTMKIWLWLIVPLFEVSPLTFIAALSLRFVIRFITAENNYDTRAAEMDSAERIAHYTMHGILGPLTALGIGYVISLFV